MSDKEKRTTRAKLAVYHAPKGEVGDGDKWLDSVDGLLGLAITREFLPEIRRKVASHDRVESYSRIIGTINLLRLEVLKEQPEEFSGDWKEPPSSFAIFGCDNTAGIMMFLR
ncbi:MAG: hypothetical protein V1487_01920 [bacterium]